MLCFHHQHAPHLAVIERMNVAVECNDANDLNFTADHLTTLAMAPVKTQQHRLGPDRDCFTIA